MRTASWWLSPRWLPDRCRRVVEDGTVHLAEPEDALLPARQLAGSAG
jgi:hypothetical protein